MLGRRDCLLVCLSLCACGARNTTADSAGTEATSSSIGTTDTTSSSSGTTAAGSESTMGTSESTDDGESDETTDGPVDECPPPDPELLAMSFSADLEIGVFARSCTVTANDGLLADGETITLTCPTNGPDEVFVIDVHAQSSDGEGPTTVAVEPGQQVEWLRWIGPTEIAVVMRDTASQRLLLAYLGGPLIPVAGFIDGEVPEPDFLTPFTLDVAAVCPPVCDPGGGLFLPACDTCTFKRTVTLTVGDESASIEHNSAGSAPDGVSAIWAFVRSVSVTSENCESSYGDETHVILVAG